MIFGKMALGLDEVSTEVRQERGTTLRFNEELKMASRASIHCAIHSGTIFYSGLLFAFVLVAVSAV